jgi:hypothetical protein
VENNFEFERMAFCIAAECLAVFVFVVFRLIIVLRNQARNERDDRRENDQR